MSSSFSQPTMVAPSDGKRSRQAVTWLFVGVILGYPVAGLLASVMNWDSEVASIPLRIMILLLSVWLVLTTRSSRRHSAGLWLVLFCGAYLSRLAWDTAVVQVTGAFDAMVFFLVTVLIPATALWRSAASLSEAQATRLMFLVGSASCIFALGLHTLGIGQARSFTEVTGRLSFEALNAITIGHTAVSTLIAALCLTRHGLRPKQAPLLIVGGFAAGTALLLAASRGPLICLAAAGLVYTVAIGRWFWPTLITLALASVILTTDSELLIRFSTIEQDQSALERVLLQTNSIDQFLSHPLLGSAFVELELHTYPHNLFLETAIALGILGLLLLLSILGKAARAVPRQIRSGNLLIVLLFVQYFVGAQVSGAIYGHGSLAACLVLLIATRSKQTEVEMRRRITTYNSSISTEIK